MEMNMEKVMDEIKVMLQERLMLPYSPEEIDSDALLFDVEDIESLGPDVKCLGLDSVDGLEIMVGIQHLYQVNLDAEENPHAYKSVRTLAEEVCKLKTM